MPNGIPALPAGQTALPSVPAGAFQTSPWSGLAALPAIAGGMFRGQLAGQEIARTREEHEEKLRQAREHLALAQQHETREARHQEDILGLERERLGLTREQLEEQRKERHDRLRESWEHSWGADIDRAYKEFERVTSGHDAHRISDEAKWQAAARYHDLIHAQRASGVRLGFLTEEEAKAFKTGQGIPLTSMQGIVASHAALRTEEARQAAIAGRREELTQTQIRAQTAHIQAETAKLQRESKTATPKTWAAVEVDALRDLINSRGQDPRNWEGSVELERLRTIQRLAKEKDYDPQHALDAVSLAALDPMKNPALLDAKTEESRQKAVNDFMNLYRGTRSQVLKMLGPRTPPAITPPAAPLTGARPLIAIEGLTLTNPQAREIAEGLMRAGVNNIQQLQVGTRFAIPTGQTVEVYEPRPGMKRLRIVK